MQPIKITHWKYLNTVDIVAKHAFSKDSELMAICGRTPVGYANSAGWEKDPEKLEKLRECKRCVKIFNDYSGNPELEGTSTPIGPHDPLREPAVRALEAL